jgi:excisionase family DNA binding protein
MSKRDEDSLYTVTYAAKLLGLTKNGGYEAAKRGDIPTIKIGRLIKVPKAALHAMIDAAGQKLGDTRLRMVRFVSGTTDCTRSSRAMQPRDLSQPSRSR